MPSFLRRSLPLEEVARFARPMAVGYLAVPLAIFLFGYLWWPWAVLFLVGLMLMLREMLGGRRRAGEVEPHEGAGPTIQVGQFLLLLGVAIVFLGISGVGGFGPQDLDWPKHNAILGDLIEKSWPATYEAEGVHLPMSYYVAYYLPAALVGKLAGWQAANLALFAWTYLGLSLAILWFMILVRHASWKVLLLFVAFSGMDFLGQAFWSTGSLEQATTWKHWTHIEWWAYNWQYSSHSAQLFWVPHQALAGWLITSLVLHDLFAGQARRSIVAYGALVSLWSPFILVGLLPLGIASLILPGPRSGPKRLVDYVTWANVIGFVLFVVIAMFYAAREYPVPLESTPAEKGFMMTNARAMDESRTFQESYQILFVYGLFIALEVMAYLVIVGSAWKRLVRSERVLLGTIAVLLLLWPLYRYGHFNDLTMRASMPSLFILCILLARTLFGRLLPRRFVRAALIVLVIGSITPVLEWTRHAPTRETILRPWKVPTHHSLDQFSVAYPHLHFDSFLRQYVSSPEAPFFRWFAKPLAGEES